MSQPWNAPERDVTATRGLPRAGAWLGLGAAGLGRGRRRRALLGGSGPAATAKSLGTEQENPAGADLYPAAATPPSPTRAGR